MSIVNNLHYAVEHYKKDELDAAFIHSLIAVDALSKKQYPDIKRNNARFKLFLKSNLLTICKYGIPGIEATHISFIDKSNTIVEPQETGRATIEEVLYHMIRCEYIHEAELTSNIVFADQTTLSDDNSQIVIPKTIILGIIAAVALQLSSETEKLTNKIVQILSKK